MSTPALGRKRRALYADDLFSKRYTSMLERIEKDPSKVADPLGEFGKLLPSAVGRIVGQKVRLPAAAAAGAEDDQPVGGPAPDTIDGTFLVDAESDELFQRTATRRSAALLPLLRAPEAHERR